MLTKVLKFGGTSLANISQFEKVCSIINDNIGYKLIIVVSAFGTDKNHKKKMTDLLFDWQKDIENGKIISESLFDIISRLNDFKNYFGEEIYDELQKCSLYKNQNFTVSRGEYFSGKILSKMLGAKFVSPLNFISKNNDVFNYELITYYLEKELKISNILVVPGFYYNENGKIKLFERGGSDLSAALIASALKCEYENWKDTDGIFDFDPQKVDKAKLYDEISYKKLGKILKSNSQVFQYLAYKVCEKNKVKLSFKNTNNKNLKGTIVK